MIAAAMPLVGEVAFATWLHRAEPGERIAYHEGHLGFDRAFNISPFPEPVRAEINRVAVQAMDLAEQGRVLLAQRRVAGDRVAYFVIKAAPAKPKGGRP